MEKKDYTWIWILLLAVAIGAIVYITWDGNWKKDFNKQQVIIDSMAVEIERNDKFEDSLITENLQLNEDLIEAIENVRIIRNEKIIIIDRSFNDAISILSNYSYD